VCVDALVQSRLGRPPSRSGNALNDFRDVMLCPFSECGAEWTDAAICAAVFPSTAEQMVEGRAQRHVRAEQIRSKRLEICDMASTWLQIQSLQDRLRPLDRVVSTVPEVLGFVCAKAQGLRSQLEGCKEKCLVHVDTRAEMGWVAKCANLLQQLVSSNSVETTGSRSTKSLAARLREFDMQYALGLQKWSLTQRGAAQRARLGLEGSERTQGRVLTSAANRNIRVQVTAAFDGNACTSRSDGRASAESPRCGSKLCDCCSHAQAEGIMRCNAEETPVSSATGVGTRCPRCSSLTQKDDKWLCTASTAPFEMRPRSVDPFGSGENVRETCILNSFSEAETSLRLRAFCGDVEIASLLRDIESHLSSRFPELSSIGAAADSFKNNFASRIRRTVLADLSKLFSSLCGFEVEASSVLQEIELSGENLNKVVNLVMAKACVDGFTDLQVKFAAGILSEAQLRKEVLFRRSAVSASSTLVLNTLRARQQCVDVLINTVASLQPLKTTDNATDSTALVNVQQQLESIWQDTKSETRGEEAAARSDNSSRPIKRPTASNLKRRLPPQP
jgi:hypothetical protein